MSARACWIITVQGIAVMVAASLYTLWRVGGEVMLPIHFDASGQPNHYAHAPWALGIGPLMAVALSVALPLLARIMPLTENLERSATAWHTARLSVLGVLMVTHLGLIATALGHSVDMRRLHAFALGMSMAVVGNVLGKVRPNHLLGIRTPWTRADEWVWDRTHRFGGWLSVIGGLVLMVLAVFLPPGVLRGPSLTFSVVMTVAAIAWVRSYLYWRVRPNR
ncbi:SdpI family protein [Nitrospirillum sp. BR 11163]|uniref:SdpI family protein n=1 Tax=Nitrospirillum sp. BR 11163 TaxID=3104323 RepID=UPI002AFF7530|nr:SdpI family protein [Nitrospirillum sp. BR 11163]MEA1676669.1 SdpI family protein [Nitrospirillum sp. BR 11163]